MNKQKHFYLIRGLVREHLHWHDFPELLLGLYPNAKITMIDIPGAGEYLSVTTPLSVKGMVEIMHRKYLANHTEGEESILVAVSLGGMIGCAWMKEHPEDFHKAVFINTSFGGYSPVYHRMRPSAFIYLSRVVLLSGREKEAHVLKLVSNNKARFDKTLDHWDMVHQKRPIAGATTVRQLLAAVAFSVGPFSPSIPVYLIGSTHDRMVNIKCSRIIAKKWNAPLVEHPQGGHDLTSDYPEWVAEEISKFIGT